VPGKLRFGTRDVNDIVICDFCKYYKCEWLEFSPKKYPYDCPEARELTIADEEISRDEFKKRTSVAKRISVYYPDVQRWFINSQKAKKIHGRELMSIMDEVNTWSVSNDFRLSDMVRYVDEKKKTAQKKLM